MSRQNTSFISRTQSFEKSRRFIQSVSDIYGKDEMEELLDEIRHLEPCNFQSDDIQDFEIDGSRHLHHTRGESTISVSVQSWDSHAVYRHKMDSMKVPVEAIQSILVHFRPSQCLEKLELFRLAFLVSSTIFKLCDWNIMIFSNPNLDMLYWISNLCISEWMDVPIFLSRVYSLIFSIMHNMASHSWHNWNHILLANIVAQVCMSCLLFFHCIS